MFLDFSLVDDFNDFPIVEVLLCLLNIRDLRFNETLSYLWAEEIVLIVFNNWVLALKEDFIEPLSCIVHIILMDLEYFISRIILSGIIFGKIPLHSNFTSKNTPSSHIVILV